MSTTHMRSRGRSSAALATGLFFLLGASQALAASMGLTFNGPSDSAGKHWGVSASSATSSGIPILQAPLFGSQGNLSITKQELSSISLRSSELDTPFEVSSDWTTKAQRSLKGSEVFLVFTSIDPRTVRIGGKTRDVNYDPTQVGLHLDSADGWVLMQVNTNDLGTVYYPAIRLGPLRDGGRKSVEIPYFLQQLVTCSRTNCSNTLPAIGKSNRTLVPLPKLRIAVALVPIPEPGTALLLGFGLIGLALRKRSHS